MEREELIILAAEALEYARKPNSEADLGTSELLFVALINALATGRIESIARLVMEVERSNLFPWITFYLGKKLQVLFNTEFNILLKQAVSSARFLNDEGHITIPEVILINIDQISEVDVPYKQDAEEDWELVSLLQDKMTNGVVETPAFISTGDQADQTTDVTLPLQAEIESTIGPKIKQLFRRIIKRQSKTDEGQKSDLTLHVPDILLTTSSPKGFLIDEYVDYAESAETFFGPENPEMEKESAETETQNSNISRVTLLRSLEEKKSVETETPNYSSSRLVGSRPVEEKESVETETPNYNTSGVVGRRPVIHWNSDSVEDATNNLWNALERNDPQAAQHAIDRGANLDRRDKLQRTVLHIASMNGYVELINVLLGADADVEAETITGDRPIHLAATYGRELAVLLLLEANAKAAPMNKSGLTPLQLALHWGHTSTAEVLEPMQIGLQHAKWDRSKIDCLKSGYPELPSLTSRIRQLVQ